ncbi:hypothetical protein [Paenibacillus alba]|uniref:Uncharacterized protein n=1 Tax=Paenibacillus alba TaxID=1197127 RepID=A0ABU6FY38_9BACL|nr:hypothetical protein [Paenibacillus alba]MEC0226792.1 hypothetical protein [Paenibacillus alba]NQX68418.1 hypothetical protein [Paenibacillus alba]
MRTTTFTWLFTFLGAALCLVHYLFHDHDAFYMIFYALSIPAWFASTFTNIYEISMSKMLIIYVLTIATWTIVGYVIDRYSVSHKQKKTY